MRVCGHLLRFGELAMGGGGGVDHQGLGVANGGQVGQELDVAEGN